MKRWSPEERNREAESERVSKDDNLRAAMAIEGKKESFSVSLLRIQKRKKESFSLLQKARASTTHALLISSQDQLVAPRLGLHSSSQLTMKVQKKEKREKEMTKKKTSQRQETGDGH